MLLVHGKLHLRSPDGRGKILATFHSSFSLAEMGIA
jgi:hypothetical protein